MVSRVDFVLCLTAFPSTSCSIAPPRLCSPKALAFSLTATAGIQRCAFGAPTCRALIPVMVIRGKDADSKIVLVNSAVHGDELQGIRVVQMLFDMTSITPGE